MKKWDNECKLSRVGLRIEFLIVLYLLVLQIATVVKGNVVDSFINTVLPGKKEKNKFVIKILFMGIGMLLILPDKNKSLDLNHFIGNYEWK